MQLNEYLEWKKITITEFALTLSVSHETVRRYVRGVRRPNAALVKLIAEKTGGAVTPNDFYMAA